MRMKPDAAEPPRYLEREFRTCVAASYDREPPPGQMREMRRMFFAGALSFRTVLFNRMGGTDEIEPADIALMDQLQAELDAFGRALREGEA